MVYKRYDAFIYDLLEGLSAFSWTCTDMDNLATPILMQMSENLLSNFDSIAKEVIGKCQVFPRRRAIKHLDDCRV